MRMLRSRSFYILWTIFISSASASAKCQVANNTLNLGLAAAVFSADFLHCAKSHRWCYEKFLLLSQSRQQKSLNFDDLNGIMLNKEMQATENIFLKFESEI